jgi:hypothetical protein
MITRRRLLIGGLASIAAYPECSRCQTLSEGCLIAIDQAQALLGHEQVWVSYSSVETGSGDRDFDRALAETLVFLSDRFFVLPSFAFVNEPGSPNAFAFPTWRMGRLDGSVLFGRKMFQKVMSRPEHPEIGIVAVCAHEFGHIAQSKYGVDNRLVGSSRRTKRLELHADFLSGYFAGVKSEVAPEF